MKIPTDPVVVSGWPLGGDWRWSVRTMRWKLMAGRGPDGEASLFSLAADPSEKKNVAEANRSVASLLAAEIERYRRYARDVAAGADNVGADYEPSGAAKKLAAGAAEAPR